MPRILLVEDNPDDEELTLRAIRRAVGEVDVRVARDGLEALQALGLIDAGDTSDAPPDLVLLDLKLPKIDGLDVLRRIRRHPATEGLTVVMLTSSDEPGDMISASMLNASRYLKKPVDYLDFMQAVGCLVQEFLAARD